MISDQLRAALRPLRLLYSLMWAVPFINFGMYYFIAHLLTSQEPVAAATHDQTVSVLFGVMAGVCLLAGLGLKSVLFSQRRAQRFLSRRTLATEDTPGGLTPEDHALAELARRGFVFYIISLGMVNACAMFGMILTMMQRDIGAFTPFLIGGIVGQILCFPRLDAFLQQAMANREHAFPRDP